MVIAELEVKTEVKTLHESIFWEEDDPRWGMTKLGEPSRKVGDAQIVDLENDAYIWVYIGPRGAGKTIGMTYYAAKAVFLYKDARLVSNYPISFILNRIDGKSTYHEAEPLDLYKLLCFDKDYHHCIILMDEAPDIISHMASMTWKNRLLNIFVRQLRKNMNTLFLGAQQFTLIDKSMRWQTDIVCQCQDAFRIYGGSQGLVRGACTLLDMYDNSGQWTGHAKNISRDGDLEHLEPDESLELPGKSIWGAFNTYYQQDIFESLKRVDMKLGSYQIGEKEPESGYVKRGVALSLAMDGGVYSTVELYNQLGEGTDAEKQKLGKLWRKCNVKTSQNGKIKDFSELDKDKLERLDR